MDDIIDTTHRRSHLSFLNRVYSRQPPAILVTGNRTVMSDLRLYSTSFVSRRLNPSTFVLSEDDSYGEQPYIYVKLGFNSVIITDTGCNSPRDKTIKLTSLRQFIEEYPIPSYNNQSLNPNGEKPYIIICTHCHYDHILGLPEFLSSNPTIVASENGKSFILEDLPTSSLCKYMNVSTPDYKVSHWARQLEYFSMHNTHFRIQFIQIPGVSSIDHFMSSSAMFSSTWMFHLLLPLFFLKSSLMCNY